MMIHYESYYRMFITSLLLKKDKWYVIMSIYDNILDHISLFIRIALL